MDVSSRTYFLDRESLAIGDSVVRYLHSEFGPGWLYFSEPDQVFRCHRLDEVETTLSRVEDAVSFGGYAVGFLSYDAGPAFHSKLAPASQSLTPLLWYSHYNRPPEFAREILPAYDEVPPVQLCPEWDLEDYSERFERVKAALFEGSSYQVNLTSRLQFEPTETMFRLFRRVCGTMPPPYATFIDCGDIEVASFSPELFLERSGNLVTMRPMKGTRRTGDRVLPSLTQDPKSLAENLMIVDMVRNDLGRIADTGSVVTPELFVTESHRTVQQMTSTVQAKTLASLSEVIRATFPPASVTGAPKLAACELISSLEASSRELYCGAIGLLDSSGGIRLSVGIRTAWKHKSDARAKYGVGGGLVWDSRLEDEFEECQLKAKILTSPAPQWELVECFHRDALSDASLFRFHWERLSQSAHLLGIPLDRATIETLLAPYRADPSSWPSKFRIALRRSGEISLSLSESSVSIPSLRATLAKDSIRSGDPNLSFKTNSRQVFDDALASREGFDEVLLHNENGEVAEFCRGNALFLLEGRWVTPVPESGCLPGVGARRLVEQGFASYERVTVRQALSSSRVEFVNSIRGRVPVELVPFDPQRGWCFGPDTMAR